MQLLTITKNVMLINVTTSSYDPTNVTGSIRISTFSYQPPFNEVGIIICAFIIFLLLFVGFFANLLTMAVILTYKELNQNVFMRFIFSLCVSDLTSALISWLFLYRRTWGFDHWHPMPDFLCKLYWGVDITTSYVTALHILSFAILRFISIQRPLVYRKLKIVHGNIWMALIWSVCICSAFIPCIFIFGSGERDRSSGEPHSRWPACTALMNKLSAYRLYQRTGYTIFFYGPTVGVVITCVAIVILVAVKSRKVATTSSAQKRKQKEKRAVVQLLLIILSFLIGFIPFTAYEFWSVEHHPNDPYYLNVDYWFGMIGYFFLRISECLNPLFYNLGSPKVYKHTKLFLKTKLCVCCSVKIRNKLCCGSQVEENISGSGTNSSLDRLAAKKTTLPVAFTPTMQPNKHHTLTRNNGTTHYNNTTTT